jgi:hypothetical protein
VGALCLACAGKQVAVIAYRVVPVGICSGRSRRRAKLSDCFSPPEHTGVPDVVRVQSAACSGLPSGQFISIRLGHEHGAFWDSSCSVGLLDLPAGYIPRKLGILLVIDGLGWVTESFRTPISDSSLSRSWGTVLHALALDQGLEDSGADSAVLS